MPHRGLRAVVFAHLPFEDLGTLEPRLTERGFQIETVDVATARFPLPQAEACDLLIVLGGPIGVYDARDYPFLTAELDLIRGRLAARQPLLGICLGAQLMAAALESRVYPGQSGPEIGWSAIQAPASSTPPEWFKPLLDYGLQVFHWHGDTFELPPKTTHLAKSQIYENQAFIYGDFALALQFHPEVTAEGLERWYVGHACELGVKKIAVSSLREAAARHAPALAEAARQFWNGWLDSLFPRR